MRKSPYLDFPAHVHLETNALCNAACNFCPYPTLERKGTKMPDRAHHQDHRGPARHSAEPARFSCHHSKSIEPFLDTRLFSILAQINQRLPNASLTLTTNASAITEKQLARLGGVRNLAYLWISMNDHREAEYEATMKLPYRRTIERMRMIHAARATNRLRLRIVLSRVGDGTSGRRRLRAMGAARVPTLRGERLSARRLAQSGRHTYIAGAARRMRSMVRSVDYRHRHRRALLHGRGGEVSDRRREPPARPRGLQRSRLSAATRAHGAPTGRRAVQSMLVLLSSRSYFAMSAYSK